jgi:hypothetical protein
MFVFLAFMLLIAWVLGFVVFHVTSAAIHILIGLAVVSLALHALNARTHARSSR